MQTIAYINRFKIFLLIYNDLIKFFGSVFIDKIDVNIIIFCIFNYCLLYYFVKNQNLNDNENQSSLTISIRGNIGSGSL